MILRRRHPDDIADLAHLQHKLEQARKHAAHQAERINDQDATIRRLVESADHWRGEARRLVAEQVNAKAAKRASS